MTLPNLLTLLRIALIPVLVFFFYLPFGWAHWLAALIFALAAITDWFDGFLARALSQTTRLGAFLDPVADKLIVAVALVLLVGEPHLRFIAIPAAIIVGREIVVSGLREWMAELGKRTSVAVSFIGKAKTFMQMLAIIFLLSYSEASMHRLLLYSGYTLLYVAAVLTLWSMCLYLKAAWPEFSQANAETIEQKID